MENIWAFSEKLKNTKKLAIFVIGLVSLSLFILQTDDAESISIIPISRQAIFNFDLLLVVSLIFIFILESFYFLTVGKIEPIRKLIAKFLSFLSSFLTILFKYTYLIPLSLLLKPVIVYVVENRKPRADGIKFRFTTKGIGIRADDHYYDRALSVEELSILVNPKGDTSYWRFGLKFSEDDSFPTARFDQSHILFHLTKEPSKHELEYNLYKDGNHTRSSLLQNYSDQPCQIVIKTTNSNTSIKVLDEYGQQLKRILIPKQRKAQLFLWADGQTVATADAVINEK